MINIDGNILKSFYLTEKFFYLSKKNNVIIFKVNRYSNKFQILNAFNKYFNIRVFKIRTILVKKIIKNKKTKINRICFWKKAYIYLKKGEIFNIDSISNK